MPFDFLFPLKGVSGDDGDMVAYLHRPLVLEAIATFHMCNQITVWVLVQILLKRLKSVVLNAILNLGVKQSLENNHYKSLSRVATFREKE